MYGTRKHCVIASYYAAMTENIWEGAAGKGSGCLQVVDICVGHCQLSRVRQQIAFQQKYNTSGQMDTEVMLRQSKASYSQKQFHQA